MAHRVGRDVRDVDDHADTVHLADNFFAEVREASVSGVVRRRVCPVDRVGMGESHVADAKCAQRAERGERVLD